MEEEEELQSAGSESSATIEAEPAVSLQRAFLVPIAGGNGQTQSEEELGLVTAEEDVEMNGLLRECAQDPGVLSADSADAAKEVLMSLTPELLSLNHFVYDIKFSTTDSIGLNLSSWNAVRVSPDSPASSPRRSPSASKNVAQSQVRVESFAAGSYPAKELGLIHVRDLIVSASAGGKFLRCVKSTNSLISFLRSSPRPVYLRLRRSPTFLTLEQVLRNPRLVDIFLEFLHRYETDQMQQPPTSKSKTKRNLSLLSLRRLSSRRGEDDADGAERYSQGSKEVESSWRKSLARITRPFTAPAHVLFVLDCFDLEQLLLSSEDVAQILQSLVNLTSQYLLEASKTSVRDIFERQEFFARASPLLSELSNDISQLKSTSLEEPNSFKPPDIAAVRNIVRRKVTPLKMIVVEVLHVELFPIFLQDGSAQAVYESLGMWNRFQSSVRPVPRYLPLMVVLKCEKAANGLMLHLSRIGMHSESAVALRLWMDIEYRLVPLLEGGQVSKSSVDNALCRLYVHCLLLNSEVPDLEKVLDRISDQLDGEAIQECKRKLAEFQEKLVSKWVSRELMGFLSSRVGDLLNDCFDQACLSGDRSSFTHFIPRISQLLDSAEVARDLVVHRMAEVPSEPDFSAYITHALVFAADDNGEASILGSRSFLASGTESYIEEPNKNLPPHLEQFFIPQGQLIEPGSLPFAFNFTVQSTDGRELMGACVVSYCCKNEQRKELVGICLLSEDVNSVSGTFLRQNLSECWKSLPSVDAFAWDPREDVDENLTSLANCCRVANSQEFSEEIVAAAKDNYICTLIQCLGSENIVALMESCLLENKVMFVSSKYTVLGHVMQALRELLQPFQWCHIFIPVLPRILLDNLQCPAPFMIGINQEFAFKRDFPYSVLDVVVVDLDEGTLQIPDGFRCPTAPPLRRWFLSRLRSLIQNPLKEMDNVHTVPAGALPTPPYEEIRTLCRSFVKALLKNSLEYCAFLRHGKEEFVLFDESSFLSQADDHDEFTLRLLRSQGFSSYLIRGHLSLIRPEIK